MRNPETEVSTDGLLRALRTQAGNGNEIAGHAANTIEELEKLVAILADQVNGFEKKQREDAAIDWVHSRNCHCKECQLEAERN